MSPEQKNIVDRQKAICNIGDGGWKDPISLEGLFTEDGAPVAFNKIKNLVRIKNGDTTYCYFAENLYPLLRGGPQVKDPLTREPLDETEKCQIMEAQIRLGKTIGELNSEIPLSLYM